MGNVNRYAEIKKTAKEPLSRELLITSVANGSIITDIIHQLPAIYPLFNIENMEAFNSGIDFIENIKDLLLAIGISKAEGKSKDLSAKDAKTRRALTKIANYPLNNKGGVVIIGNNNENNIYVAINHNNAKQLSNDLNLKADDVFPDEIIHKNVILRLAQGNDINPLKTNKGIISNFDSKAKTLLFDDNAVRESILHGRNPFLVYFAVDVAVRSVDDKIVAYVIKSCNGVISDEEDSKESIPTLFT